MSGINGLGPVAAAQRTTRQAKPASGGFMVATAFPANATSGAAATEMSLAGLLALQAEGEDAIHDREARRRGRDLLAELDALRHALLKGDADPGPLLRLAGLAADLPVAGDPRLRDLLDQIALRAQVELARHGL